MCYITLFPFSPLPLSIFFILLYAHSPLIHPGPLFSLPHISQLPHAAILSSTLLRYLDHVWSRTGRNSDCVFYQFRLVSSKRFPLVWIRQNYVCCSIFYCVVSIYSSCKLEFILYFNIAFQYIYIYLHIYIYTHIYIYVHRPFPFTFT